MGARTEQGRNGISKIVMFIWKSINVIHHINRLKDKSHMISSIDAEKTFHEIQQPFILEIVEELGIVRTHLNIIKVVYTKPQGQHHSKWRKTESILSKNLNKIVMPISPLLFHMVFESLTRAIRQEKKIKGI